MKEIKTMFSAMPLHRAEFYLHLGIMEISSANFCPTSG